MGRIGGPILDMWGEFRHYTYILYDHEELICKIGYSWKPELRRSRLSKQYKLNFKIISQKEFNNAYDAFQYEQQWLHTLKAFNLGGEYFLLDKNQMEHLIKNFMEGVLDGILSA